MNEVKNRIETLEKLITQWAHSYYVDNYSIVSDSVYDQHFQELKQLYKEYPQLEKDNSVVDKVLGEAQKGFEVLRHITPMLSLNTITDYTRQGVVDFVDKVRNELGDDEIEFIAELKYDGLGIDLQYERGKLVAAITRGDGEYGENVLENILAYTNVPRILEYAPELLFIRGEVVMPKKVFNSINEQREIDGLKLLANPRNAASGIIRRLSKDKEPGCELRFLAYQIVDPGSELYELRKQSQVLDHLGRLCFTSGITVVTDNVNTLWEFHENAQKWRDTLEYEIDGVVYKVNGLGNQHVLGWNAREPRWAIAHKFPPVEAITTLESIDVQIGRTGAITPVARLKPVYVGGVVISNVTLHNVFDLRARGVRQGDTVIVRRAGDVIPEIVKYPEYVRDKYHPNFKMPFTCPSCNSPIVRSKGERKYYCNNGINCPAQASALYAHFTSKSGMRIDGLAEKTIRQLIDAKLLTGFHSFYTLTEQDFLTLEGFESVKAKKIVSNIERSKEVPLSRFIYALGIRYVGEQTSKDLAKHFGSIEELVMANIYQLLTMPSIGDVTAVSVYEFLHKQNGINIIKDLLAVGVSIINPSVGGTALSGKNIAITGSFKDTSRDYVKELIINNGGKVSSSVTKNTTYLVAGEGGGEKRSVAQRLNIPIITLGELAAMLA